jgi:hypothetical protein
MALQPSGLAALAVVEVHLSMEHLMFLNLQRPKQLQLELAELAELHKQLTILTAILGLLVVTPALGLWLLLMVAGRELAVQQALT